MFGLSVFVCLLGQNVVTEYFCLLLARYFDFNVANEVKLKLFLALLLTKISLRVWLFGKS